MREATLPQTQAPRQARTESARQRRLAALLGIEEDDIDALTRAISEMPGTPELHEQRARVHRRRGDWRASMDDYACAEALRVTAASAGAPSSSTSAAARAAVSDEAPTRATLGALERAVVAAGRLDAAVRTSPRKPPPRISLRQTAAVGSPAAVRSVADACANSHEPLLRAACSSPGRRRPADVALLRSTLVAVAPALELVADTLDNLCQAAELRAFRRDELVEARGDAFSGLGIVLEGLVALQKRRDVPADALVPQHTNLALVEPGASFGGFRLMRAAEACTHMADVRALRRSRVLWFLDEHLEQLMSKTATVIPHWQRACFVSRLHIGPHLTWQQLLRLSSALQLRHYKIGDIITVQEELAHSVFFVHSGRVVLRRGVLVNGEVSMLDVAELAWGDVFGVEALSFGTGSARPHSGETAVALSECRLLVLDRVNVLPTLQSPGSAGALLSTEALSMIRRNGALPDDRAMIERRRALLDWERAKKRFSQAVLREASRASELRRGIFC